MSLALNVQILLLQQEKTNVFILLFVNFIIAISLMADVKEMTEQSATHPVVDNEKL